ncbi:MAG: hypothetical protein M3243_04885 [Thermoproteota archaeon]|nr:hypothetical protein [Thermoproteota archaeon]
MSNVMEHLKIEAKLFYSDLYSNKPLNFGPSAYRMGNRRRTDGHNISRFGADGTANCSTGKYYGNRRF